MQLQLQKKGPQGYANEHRTPTARVVTSTQQPNVNKRQLVFEQNSGNDAKKHKGTMIVHS
jgi:hypothetical protein